jgi:5-methylcytosine-specific restriction endonuclease McrA
MIRLQEEEFERLRELKAEAFSYLDQAVELSRKSEKRSTREVYYCLISYLQDRMTKEFLPEESNREPLKQSERTTVFEKDKYTCQKCGRREALQVDHIIPVSKGGTNDLSNLQTLCRSCNLRKGAHHV